MRKREGGRRRLFLALRVLASAVMLGVLLTRLELSSLVPERDAATVRWVVAGLVVMLAAMVLATLRWQRVLSAMELPSHLPPLLSHSLAGQFVANFLPSTIGGDVLRVTRLSASNGQPPASFASVVVERLTGFLVLPCITLVALLSHPSLLHLGRASWLALSLSMGTLLVLVVVVLLAVNPRLGGRLAGNDNWLRFVAAVHLGLNRILRHPGMATTVLATAFAYQLTIVLAFWMAAQALGIEVGWSAMMAFTPVVAMAQVIPLSVAGLGLREGALVLVLGPLGVTTAQAVALGLLLYGMNLVVSLLGAPAFAVGPRRVDAAPTPLEAASA